MSDNVPLPAATGSARTIDRGGAIQTQVIALDVGGEAGPEQLVTANNPFPTADSVGAAAQTSDRPQFVAITGDPDGDFAGVNILEQLLDDGSGFAASVRVVNPPKVGKDGGLLLSDCPVPISLSGVTANVTTIDTQGYQSFVAHSSAGGSTGGAQGTFSTSNDGINYRGCLVTEVAGSTFPSSVGLLGQATEVTGACTGRYLRWTCTVPGAPPTLYLRSAPYVPSMGNMNIAMVNGSAVGQNQAGMMVSGTVTAGNTAPSSSFPIPIAGFDNSLSATGVVTPLSRLIKTDLIGRVQTSPVFDHTASTSGTAAPRQIGVANPTSFQNSLAINVQDTSQFEGQGAVELLAQILLELRILNQQTYEMSAIVNGLQLAPNTAGVQSGNLYLDDDPAAYRADPTVFTQFTQ